MRYVSLFSGIEAASVAWGPLGYEPMAFAEVDPFACAVLAERFPEVPNLGDVTKIDWGDFAREHGRPDVVVGGSPCQSFSVAGSRTGLEGESGLMWEYVRAIRELMPRWLLWENVPGALSSSHGEDFRCLLEALDACGYGLAWRVLDAKFFGLAQRRERVFLIGRLGDPDGPCKVLFEPESLRWDSPSSREKRQELAAGAGCGAACAGFAWHHGGNTGLGWQEDVSATVESNMPPAVYQMQVQGVMDGYVVRRLTPRECERLMGMPDDWTRIPYRGKPAEECPDTPRYKAIGNSMAVNVMRWLGERIQEASE